MSKQNGQSAQEKPSNKGFKLKKDGTPSRQGEGGGNPTRLRYTDEVINELADGLIAFMKKKNNFWLKAFATLNNMPADTFDYLAEKSEKFALSLKIAKQIQEEKLIRKGFVKGVNPAMAIFALKNVAGWRDRSELTGKDGQPLFQSVTFHYVQAGQKVPELEPISRN